MDLQALKTFQAVAQCGSFSGAAQKLGYAQSNVSMKIHQLEGEMGTPLCYRHNRGISLTAKGKILSQYVDSIFQLVTETTAAMQEDGTARGSLAIGSMETTAATHLPALLTAYHQAWPDVTLSLTTGTTADLVAGVVSRSLDGAFVAGPVTDAGLQTVPLVTERLGLVTACGAERAQTWRDVPFQTVLVFPEGCSYRRRVDALLQGAGKLAVRRVEFNSLGALLASVCAGLGYTVLPWRVASSYVKRQLAQWYDLPAAIASAPTVFVYRQDHFSSTAFAVLVEAVQTLRDELARQEC